MTPGEGDADQNARHVVDKLAPFLNLRNYNDV
jgi:hypothetical protein